MKAWVIGCAAILAASGALASEPAHAPPPTPPDEREAPPPPQGPDVRRVPAPGGEVVLVGPRDETAWNALRFAPVRRAGDTVYISGVVIGPRAGEAHDVPAFKAQARRAFAYVDAALKAAGLTFADVASLQTFHVWNSPSFDGDKAAQFEAFAQVKDEFFKAPYPAWTAVGVSELLSSAGVVEMRLEARAPPPPPPPPPKPKPQPKPKPRPKPAAPASEGRGEGERTGPTPNYLGVPEEGPDRH